MNKRIKRPVRSLAKYAQDYGEWLAQHRDENGKILNKNLDNKELGFKRAHTHYIEDESWNLDVQLSEKDVSAEDLKKSSMLSVKAKKYDQIVDRYNQLLENWENDSQKQWQLQAIKELMAAVEKE